MAPVNVLMVGTGEYTTGFVGGGMSGSDKKVGVVGLTLFDLRRRGKVGALSMVGTSGTKFPAIRTHLQMNITDVYAGLDVGFSSFPSDSTARDPDAYKAAIDGLRPGDAVTIFTPDPTHYAIALAAIRAGCHVLVTKPATKLLEHHADLLRESRKAGVLVMVEHHKRFDPAYADARHRARDMGDFGYFYAFMSQPKSQLQTFKAWAGKDSDISYYLNSHHVDVCASMVMPLGWVPTRVAAGAARGVAESLGCVDGTEDTITLTVRWEKDAGKKVATGVYTASWTAPQNEGVHSNQFFHYMASQGSINVDQAHRGYQYSSDTAGQTAWLNPFYMKYAPDEDGNFAGQTGYGYISLEKFVDAAAQVNAARASGARKVLESLDSKGGGALPTLANTLVTTAILEAGRRSLDRDGAAVGIEKEGEEWRLVET